MLPGVPGSEPLAPAVGRFPGAPTAGRTVSGDRENELDVLVRLCHAFPSARSVDEVARSVGFWIRDAVGSDQTTFRLLIPDAAGRLRTVASNESSSGSRKRSARRRAVFHEKRPVLIDVPGGATRGLFPLVTRGEPVGMLEVTAPGRAIPVRRGTLLAVASQVAIVLRNVRERSLLERQRSPTLGFMELVRELAAAPTPRRAIAVAARLCFEQLEVPVAGWAIAEDRSRLELTAIRGLDPAARRALKAALRTMSPRGHLSLEQRDREISTFAEVTSAAEGVTVGDAGDALLLIAGRSPIRQPFVDNVVALLRGTVGNLAVTAQAERRNRELDLGIAWTAHELRRPLLALRFLMLSTLTDQTNGGSPEGIKLLKRQLDELVKGLDGMLQWAMGGPPVRSRSFDLTGLVRAVVEVVRLEQGKARLRLAAAPAAIVRGDPSQVRHAIENLVANAVAYSPAHTEVRIAIEPDDEGVTVTVEDQGPGIPAAYREAIFDPFVRVTARPQPRGGQGLGLFIAKQIIEGHGGALWLEPGRKGAMFRLRIPRDVSGSRRFAS
jgi:signal transduction histidine kinase